MADYCERKIEVKEEHRLHSHRTHSMNGRNSHTPGRFELLETQNNGQKISYEPPIEQLCSSSFVTNASIPKERTFAPSQQHPSHTTITKLIFIVALLLAAPIIYLVNKVPDRETTKNLKSLFPQQSDRLWGFVSHGLDDRNPFVLLLVHSGQADLANCLGKHIAEKVAKGRTKKSTKPIILDGRYELPNLLTTLKPEMEKHHALVLQNIESLHGDVADKLHFILDTHEPWVPSGVYVLTLHVPSIKDNLQDSFRTIRAFLKIKWSNQINDDNLDALIARICHFEYVLREDTDPCKQNV